MESIKRWNAKAMPIVGSILLLASLARAEETLSQKTAVPVSQPAVQTTSAEAVSPKAPETVFPSQQQPATCS